MKKKNKNAIPRKPKGFEQSYLNPRFATLISTLTAPHYIGMFRMYVYRKLSNLPIFWPFNRPTDSNMCQKKFLKHFHIRYSLNVQKILR